MNIIRAAPPTSSPFRPARFAARQSRPVAALSMPTLAQFHFFDISIQKWDAIIAGEIASPGPTTSAPPISPAPTSRSGCSTATAPPASDGPTLPSPDRPRATIKLDYTICKAGKSESYTVFSTKESPRKMLREDMRGDVVSELVRIEP